MKQQNGENTKKRSKAGAIAAAAVILAAGAGTAFYLSTNAYASSEPQTSYREYSVSKGSITVGISESGTASVGRSYISLPVSAEVEEVYAKVGSEVKSGDKLAKLSTDDIEGIKEQYLSEISTAKLELDTALGEKETKLAEAKSVYEQSINGADSAEEVYELSVTKLQNDISDTEKNIESLKKQLAEYEQLLEDYPADYAEYTKYESKYEEYTDTYEEYSDVYAGYEKTLKEYNKELDALNKKYNEYLESISEDQAVIKELKDAIDQAEKTYNEAGEKYEEALENPVFSQSTDSNGTSDAAVSSQSSVDTAMAEMNKAYDEYWEAKANFNSRYVSLDKTYSYAIEDYEKKLDAMQDKIDKYKEMMEEYADMMSDYQKEMNSFKAEFDSFKEEYGKTYGEMDGEDISEKINSISAEIEKAEYELKNLKTGESSSELSARLKKEDTLLTAQTAQEVYDRTVQNLNKDISDKQEAYDDLCGEYNELLENMGDGVYIYADCDGRIASVNVSEGSTVMAEQNLFSIADTSEIYVSIAVSESDITSLSVGQETQAIFTAYEDVTFYGVIDSIAAEPARSSGSVTYTVTVKLDTDEKYDILDGMTAEATFLQKQVTDVFYANVNAVTFRDGATYVTVYGENGEPTEKQVVTGFSDGRYVEISEGVSAGDKLLAETVLSENKGKG